MVQYYIAFILLHFNPRIRTEKNISYIVINRKEVPLSRHLSNTIIALLTFYYTRK